MAFSDPLSDMLTRIRNGQRANKSSILTPSSKLRQNVLDVLQREGYIRGYESSVVRNGVREIRVDLKYIEGQPVIREIRKISKPGHRVYSKIMNLPRIYNGLGISIISTSKGILSDHEARQAHIGGEILCQIF